MRVPFVESVLETLVADRTISLSDSVVCVCAGERDAGVFAKVGFRDVTITNIDDSGTDDRYAPYAWSYQDAQSLTFDDRSFDLAFVADGLHHCSSPHLALLEMYRVARKGIIVVDSRDSFLMRTAVRFGLTPDYEVEAVIGSEFKQGGVNNTAIPNFIYRWTESEFKKAVKSFDPLGKQEFRFLYGLNLPYELAGWKRSSMKLNVIRIADPFLRAFTRVFKKQCNTLAMVALRPVVPRDLWPWLSLQDDEVVLSAEYARDHFKEIEGSGLSARPASGTELPDSDESTPH